MTTPKVRLMHLLTSFQTGGAEQVACNLLRFIDPSRFDRVACSLAGPGPMEKRFREGGVETCSIVGGGLLRSVWRLRRLLRERRVDVLHCHNRAPNICGSLAGKLAGVPAVLCTRHMSKDFPLRGRKHLMERIVARWTDYYVAISHGVYANASATNRIRPDRAAVIYNGVDTRLYSPTDGARPERAGDIVIGCVARLSEEKRHCDLLAAMRQLADTGLPVRLELVGDGAERPALERLTDELGLRERVTFLGARTDVAAMLHRFDIFALASRLEGLPLSIVEALAAGLPVVATNVGSVPEAVRDGVNGFVVPPREPAKLAEALEGLARDAGLRRRMGDAGRALAVAEFDLQAAASRHEELYMTLLKEKQHGA